jgi:hypothetical protein
LSEPRLDRGLEGALDEMLASVPDAFFEAAVAAAKVPRALTAAAREHVLS